MKAFDSTLHYKFLPPRKKPDNQSPAIVLLHGRGADENDLLGLAPHLDERLMIFSPRGPYPFSYGAGFTWFDLLPDGSADQGMFKESYDRLREFITRIHSLENINPEKIFLMGFSMGTIMSYALSLTFPEYFAGVIAQSGFIREHPELRFRWDELQHCPFFITHGTYDPVLPVTLARKTKELFARSTAEVVYREYPMGHQITDESLKDVCDWLAKKITHDT